MGNCTLLMEQPHLMELNGLTSDAQAQCFCYHLTLDECIENELSVDTEICGEFKVTYPSCE